MGVPTGLAQGSVVFSFGDNTNDDDIIFQTRAATPFIGCWEFISGGGGGGGIELFRRRIQMRKTA